MNICINWTKGLNCQGYGWLTRNKKQWLAHRYVWTQIRGAIPKGACVLHTCDNRRCVNPYHLYLGDRKDNANDAMVRDRYCRGTKHFFNKLSEAQVRAIKAAKGSSKPLAKRFGVSQTTINRIRRGELWRRLS